MHKNVSGFRTLISAALVVATNIATYTAIAQEKTGEVVVEATRPSRSKVGAPITTETAKRVVSYADISLTTESGVKVLETRIRDAAKSACVELDAKYPVTAEGDTNQKCFDNAFNGAMANARKAIDAAKFAASKKP